MENDPRKIWQAQPGEARKMTHEEMLAAASRHRNKLRMQLGGHLVMPILMVWCYVYWILKSGDPLLLTLGAMVIIWSALGQVFLMRGSAAAAGDYRGAVERRLEFLGKGLAWSFGPIAAALALLIFATWRKGVLTGETWTRALPFLTLVAVWVVAYFVLRMREMRALRKELAITE